MRGSVFVVAGTWRNCLWWHRACSFVDFEKAGSHSGTCSCRGNQCGCICDCQLLSGGKNWDQQFIWSVPGLKVPVLNELDYRGGSLKSLASAVSFWPLCVCTSCKTMGRVMQKFLDPKFHLPNSTFRSCIFFICDEDQLANLQNLLVLSMNSTLCFAKIEASKNNKK